MHVSSVRGAASLALRYLRGAMPSIQQIRKAFVDSRPNGDVRSARRASVAIVLAGDADAPSVCFVERARRAGDPWSGDVAFPGGWAKHEDETLRATAMRETREEIGLALADAHHVGDVAPMPISRVRLGAGIIGASVFYVGGTRPGLHLEQREIAGAFWVPIAHLHHPRNRTVVHWSRAGPPQPRPAILFDGRVIWGLTYRILVRFGNLVTDGRSPLEADPD